MVPICLSLAPILRCETLTRLESGIILLPPALEIIFCLGLLWAKRGSNRKHTFLAAEGFSVRLELQWTLSGPLISSLGAASSIPIFLYTFFLFLFTNSELIPTLPQRLQKFAKYILLLFIPLIVASNELGSLFSISYRTLVGVGKSSTLVVGFTNELAMIFCIAFFRLYRALSHQRNIEEAPRSEVEAYLFRGLGWIVVGMKLGAIETVVGFAQGGFTVALIRRILRLLGRGCLIIGILKGVDTVEGFQITFRHVGGQNFDTESAFADREATYEKRDSGISLSPRRIAGSPNTFHSRFQFAEAPTLHLRRP
ncbi:hypothetical protein A0H81_03158 [Grifola frondosa]|uniref:Uncharacterized protein n=1 Tax=Grifola frondosa TaxID=5627 RepID=A0A1C7MJK5_GRIFR|nr:hypothetical protein A0H81_03158 [Grifola frondosa]